MHIAYTASDVRTELTRVNLEPYGSRHVVVESLLSIEMTSGIKSATDGHVVPRGNPR